MTTRRTRIAIAAILLSLTTAIFASGQAKTAKKVPPAGKHPVVVVETTMGTMRVELYTDKAPITAKNFLDYVNSGFYNGTVIHRVDFVIGGGGYTESMMLKTPRAPIQNESKNGLKNLRGTLAMARYNDPNSATSQFFINIKDNTHLDPPPGGFGYAVFAKVIEGMDVVDKIAAVKVATKSVQGTPFSNVPVQPIIVKSAKVAS